MKKKLDNVKFKYMVLLLILFFTSQIFAAPCGDVNSNGVIDIVDALMTAQYYVGLNPQPYDTSAGDVNGDGLINIVDALQTAQYYVGLISTLAGCEIPAVTPACTSQTYELQAETDAAWDDAQVDSIHSGYTGTGFVDTANSSGRWIEWNIDISADSSATCVFTFANGSSSGRSMDVSINGSAVTNLGFPVTGAWDAWSTDTAAVILTAGLNAIRLTATNSAGAPNMDKMDITINLGCIVTPTPSPVPTPTLPGWTPSGNRDIKIMCLGDSITESDSRENSWRYLLVQNLYAAGYEGAFDMVGRNSGFRNNPDTDWDSEHCGYWSASADQLLNGGLPKGRDDHGSIRDWAPDYKPTIALIHLGTNDSRGGQSPESTLQDIEGIINHLRAAVPEVKIVVAQIIPIGVSDAERIAQDLNSKIPAWAGSITTDESSVKVVDMHSDMVIGVDQGTYHPYGAGSQKMADKWFAAIEEWF